MSELSPEPDSASSSPETAPSHRPPQWGLAVLGMAAAVGILGDWLLNTETWGINWVLWIAVLLGALALRQRYFPTSGLSRWPWLAVPSVIFGLCFAWRDAPLLRMLALLVSLLAFTIPAWLAIAGGWTRLSLGAMGRVFSDN